MPLPVVEQGPISKAFEPSARSVIVLLFAELDLNCIEEFPIEDGRLLPRAGPLLLNATSPGRSDCAAGTTDRRDANGTPATVCLI